MGKKKEEAVLKFEDILHDVTLYKELKIQLIKAIFLHRNGATLQERKSKIAKLSYNGIIYEKTLAELYMSLILARPFIEFERADWYDTKLLFDKKQDKLEYYFNIIISLFRTEDTEQLCSSLGEIILEISRLSIWTNLTVGTTVSLYELMLLADRHPRFKEIMHTDLRECENFSEMEKMINSRKQEATDIIINDPIASSYKECLQSGCINQNQFKQVICAIGPRPSITGEIIPEVINTNFLNGLRHVQDYYILMEATRKILIISHVQVKNTGYMTRKLTLGVCDITLNHEEDCGTTFHLPVVMKSKERIESFYDRWFIDEDNTYSLLSEALVQERGIDYFLGKTLHFRSPLYCSCKDDKVCKTCYGELYHVNKSYHIGRMAVLIISPELYNRMLGAKHLLETKSQEFNWPDEFTKHLYFDKSNIIVQEGSEAIVKIEELKEDEETGEWYFNACELEIPPKGLRLRSSVSVELPTNVYVSEDALKDLRSSKDAETYQLKLKNYEEQPVFYIKVQNKEIIAQLNAVKALLEDNLHDGATTIEELVDKFLDKLEEFKIEINSVHAEVIIKALIRDKLDAGAPPDWSEPCDDPTERYQILTLENSILASNRLTPGLGFENIKSQLQKPDTYYKKNKASNLDAFFRT